MEFKLCDELVISDQDPRLRTRGLRMIFIAESGAGKSYAIAKICEQALDQELQVVIFDPHGEYWTLGEVWPEKILIIGGDQGDIPLSAKASKAYSKLFEQGYSLIFDLKEILDELEYPNIVESLIRAIWRTARRKPRSALLVIEEAHLIAPQEKTRENMRRLALIKSLVGGARKFGLSLVMGTQRPAEIHKYPLSQCWIRLFGRLTERLDREAVKDYFKPMSPDVLKDPNIPAGRFWVFGWFDEIREIQVSPERKSRHGGETVLLQPIERPPKVSKDIEKIRGEVLKILESEKEREDELNRLRREKEKLLEKIEELERQLATVEIFKKIPIKVEVDVEKRERVKEKPKKEMILPSPITAKSPTLKEIRYRLKHPMKGDIEIPPAVLNSKALGVVTVYRILAEHGGWMRPADLCIATGFNKRTMRRILKYLHDHRLIYARFISGHRFKLVRVRPSNA